MVDLESKDNMYLEIVNTIKTIAMDATLAANSGHPGAPMGQALAASVLWTDYLKYDPSEPDWQNRDRFVLSCGHASILLYTLLHLSGYNLTLEDIKKFRQLGSKTPGHPEFGITEGVEATTGPLGTGFATAVGMAISQRFLAHRYNTKTDKVVDYNIYVMVSDGDLMEGIANEAASFAGHQNLSKLICLYDSNRITIDGSTDLTFTENVCKRFEAMNWLTMEVDGSKSSSISDAINKAKLEKEKPSLILCHTHIGEGSPNTQDTPLCHGSPLSPEEIELTKKNLGLPLEKFYIPASVKIYFNSLKDKKHKEYLKWKNIYKRWKQNNKTLAIEWENKANFSLDNRNNFQIPFPKKKELATRKIISDLIKETSKVCPVLVGGSADLGGSVMTKVAELASLSSKNPEGRQIFFGIRENAMGAILNGITLTVPMRAYGGTFLVFSDFMKPLIRLAALMKLPVIYLFSHDSFAVGEDGPTHQPIEQIMSLRVIPNLNVIRPADIHETIGAWKMAWSRKDGPTAIITTRQAIPVLNTSSENISKGAYVIYEPPGNQKLEAYIVATGSEVHLAIKVAQQFNQNNIRIRVVSLPCWKIFEQQSKEYRQSVLPPEIKKSISIEAGITLGWKYYAEKNLGIDSFGSSGPFKDLLEYYGFTEEVIYNKIEGYLKEKF